MFFLEINLQGVEEKKNCRTSFPRQKLSVLEVIFVDNSIE